MAKSRRKKQEAETRAGAGRQDVLQSFHQARSAGLGLGGFGIGALSERTALGVVSFWHAVQFIAEVKSSLPLKVQRRIGDSDDWETLHTHPLDWMLNNEPNPNQTAIACHHERMMHLLVHGRSTSIIRLDPADGAPLSLWPIHKTAWDIQDTPHGREYRADLLSGSEVMDRSQVADVWWTSVDNGLTSLSPLQLFATQLNLSRSLSEQAQSFWSNNPRPGLIVTSPRAMQDEEYERFVSKLNSGYSKDNAGKALVLDGGLTATPWQMTFADYQLLEMLSVTDTQIGQKVFRLPPESLEGLNYNDYFTKYTLTPWLERDEQEMTRKLFSWSERGFLRTRYDISGLMRADLKTRFDVARIGVMTALLNKNEGRRLIDHEPVPGGDEFVAAQSVFGKPGGNPGTSPVANPAPSTRADEEPDVARELLSDLLAGIYQRTRHTLDRVAKSTDWKAEIASCLLDQDELLTRKLRMLPVAGQQLAQNELRRQISQAEKLDVLNPEQRKLKLAEFSDQWTARTADLASRMME